VQVDPNEQAPDLTDRLFRLGSKLLLQYLPSILSGEAMQTAVAQPHDQATHAAKVTREDSYLDLSQPATSVHNAVRALTGWPGARAALLLEEHRKGACVLQPMEIKIMRTRVLDCLPPPSHPPHVPRKQQTHAHPAKHQDQSNSKHLSSSSIRDDHNNHSSSNSSTCGDLGRLPQPAFPASNEDPLSLPPQANEGQQLPNPPHPLSSPHASSLDGSKLTREPDEQASRSSSPSPWDGNLLHSRSSKHPEVPPCISHRPTAGPVGGAAEAADAGRSTLPAGVVSLVEGCMIIPCGHGTLLEVVEVRHSAGQFGRGKGSSLSGRDFMIGLAKRRLLLPPNAVSKVR